MRLESRPAGSGTGTLLLPARAGAAAGPGSALRVIGWCVAVALIAVALLPLAPRLGGAHAAMRLEVSGDLLRVEPDAVRRAVAGRLNADFYELDLAGVKDAVETLPWVARARVERAWPDAVRVHVWEHQAVARWGEQALLSGEDVVFQPDTLAAELAVLPRLAGPDGQQAAVRAAFDALRGALADTPFLPVSLTQNARGAWTALTADGIELRLGRGEPTDAVALLAGPVRTALVGRLQEVTYVDLHYINGFAVGWRDRSDDDRSPGLVAKGRHE